MFLLVSVILFTARGCLGPGPGARLEGLARERVSRPTPQQMASAAGVTHPTGMHSCLNFISNFLASSEV